MELRDIEKLADLARLEIQDEEKAEILKDFGAILDYIKQIEEVTIPMNSIPEYELKNVMRADVVLNESGSNTEILVAQMPDSDGSYLKVKQIL